jgi:DNA-binding CsgD family transcriptional regulator/tetratricopeptide (TPR) repeat protein
MGGGDRQISTLRERETTAVPFSFQRRAMVMNELEPGMLSLRDLLDRGHEGLAAGDWESARQCFQRAVDWSPGPEAFEGLGLAAWWLDDVSVLFQSRERAFTLYREQGDAAGAARMATWIAMDYYIYRGALAIANGWLQRATRQLDAVEYPSLEHGFMTVVQGYIALEQHDLETARIESLKGLDVSRELKDIDLEMLSQALHGLVLVSEGSVSEGMKQLDEAVAAALSGELTDPDAIVTCCCYLFYACERVRDYDRATQWCETIQKLCERWSYRSMFAVCRTHYAGVLIWRGEWSQADLELTDATNTLMSGRAGWANEGLLRLGDLRRRQGRFDESYEFFRLAAGDPRSLLGRAHLAFDLDDAAQALTLIERFLRNVSPNAITDRADALELLVRVSVATGDLSSAQGAVKELEQIAQIIGTGPLAGTMAFSRGLLAAAQNELSDARRQLEDAVDLFHRIGAPYEIARARLELARVLCRVNHERLAIAEAQEASSLLAAIGATRDAEAAAQLAITIGREAQVDVDEFKVAPGLTPRESEILLRIARGMTNPEIADELFLSVRTVERHVSSIYQKIGAEGKAARAVATAFALEHLKQE